MKIINFSMIFVIAVLLFGCIQTPEKVDENIDDRLPKDNDTEADTFRDTKTDSDVRDDTPDDGLPVDDKTDDSADVQEPADSADTNNDTYADGNFELIDKDDVPLDVLFLYNLERSPEAGIIIDPREALFEQGEQNVRGCFENLIQSDFFTDYQKSLYIYECAEGGCLSMADAIRMNVTNDTKTEDLPLKDLQEVRDAFKEKGIPFILIEYHRKEGYVFDYDHMIVGLHEYSDPTQCRIELKEE